MLKKLLLLISIPVAALLIVAALQSNEFRVERSIGIAAPAEQIFPWVNNLQKFNEWSPWAKLDPNAKAEFEGPSEGVGSKLSWNGNYEVGQGSMTNIEVKPNELARFRMDFIKPMQATDTAEFTFKADKEGTLVTWSIYGNKTYFCKLIGILFNTDKMVGDQFEKGLNTLKAMVENATQNSQT